MKNYAAPQIEWIRFDVYDIMDESGASGDSAFDPGDEFNLGTGTQGEVEPW